MSATFFNLRRRKKALTASNAPVPEKEKVDKKVKKGGDKNGK